MNMNSDFLLRENLGTVSEGPETAAGAELSVPEKLTPGPRPTLRSMRAAAEVMAIRHALQETKWNRKRAAKLLSISYRGLLYKLRQHRIVQSEVSSEMQSESQS
jgi:DNA-binding NtrC family response regulator